MERNRVFSVSSSVGAGGKHQFLPPPALFLHVSLALVQPHWCTVGNSFGKKCLQWVEADGHWGWLCCKGRPDPWSVLFLLIIAAINTWLKVFCFSSY